MGYGFARKIERFLSAKIKFAPEVNLGLDKRKKFVLKVDGFLVIAS